MFTLEIGTNGDIQCFVDGIYDAGGSPANDNEGNPSLAPPMAVTNTYYTTNLYPYPAGGPYAGSTPASNPPPNGFVRWMVPGLTASGAFTTFGGYDRNGGIASGPVMRLSDIAFWNRTLTTNEIQFVMTNGVNLPFPPPSPPRVLAFYPDMAEVGQNGTIGLHWQVLGATNVSIAGVGTNVGLSGSATVVATANQTYTFTLTAANGITAPIQRTISVKVLAGVPTDWNLIQRFDGLYSPTTNGIEDFPGDTAINPYGGVWFCVSGIYSGALDRFNVVRLNTGGENELVLSPKSGYYTATNSPFGYDSRGAIAYGYLNDYSMHPYDVHTVFFRFAVRNPGSLAANYNLYSGLDFAFGLTDFGFATGPLGGANPPSAGTVGPGFKIISCDTTGALQLKPFDLVAANYSGSSYLAGYDYMTDAVNGNAGGLQTNVTYMVWLDVSNDNTHEFGVGAASYTTNEPIFGLWLQREGGTQVQLFSGYGGNRDWSWYEQNNSPPINILNKIFTSVGTESFLNADWAAFIETNNMIVLDDFYLSTNGYDHSLPRPLAIQSIARGSTNATITWYSLGSLFQTNTYSIQRTFGLTPTSWTTLASGVPAGGDFTSYNDKTLGTTNPMAFYRITWP